MQLWCHHCHRSISNGLFGPCCGAGDAAVWTQSYVKLLLGPGSHLGLPIPPLRWDSGCPSWLESSPSFVLGSRGSSELRCRSAPSGQWAETGWAALPCLTLTTGGWEGGGLRTPHSSELSRGGSQRGHAVSSARGFVLTFQLNTSVMKLRFLGNGRSALLSLSTNRLLPVDAASQAGEHPAPAALGQGNSALAGAQLL